MSECVRNKKELQSTQQHWVKCIRANKIQEETSAHIDSSVNQIGRRDYQVVSLKGNSWNWTKR